MSGRCGRRRTGREGSDRLRWGSASGLSPIANKRGSVTDRRLLGSRAVAEAAIAESSAVISRNPDRRIRCIRGSPDHVSLENAAGSRPETGALRPGRDAEFRRGRADVSGNRTVLQRTAGPNRRFSREPWADPDGSPENRAKKTAAIPVAWPRFSRASTRSNNRRTLFDPESPRKGRLWGPMAHLHQRCVGCGTQGRPGRSDSRFVLYERSEDRRR